MTDNRLLPFELPTVACKKVSVAFYGGLIPADGGLALPLEAERRLRLAETLAGCIRDPRNQAQVVLSSGAVSGCVNSTARLLSPDAWQREAPGRSSAFRSLVLGRLRG